jgi:hypothetical protein
MERINKTVRKLRSIPEMDALKAALDEHDRLTGQKPYTLARLQAEDALDEARELMAKYERDRNQGTGQENNNED